MTFPTSPASHPEQAGQAVHLPSPALVVTVLAGSQLVVRVQGLPEVVPELIARGFQQKGRDYVHAVVSEEERIAVTRELMTMGALFTGGTGWSPSELVASYRDQRILEGGYAEIVWRDPDHFVIRHYP